jgi:hypothetical protein
MMGQNKHMRQQNPKPKGKLHFRLPKGEVYEGWSMCGMLDHLACDSRFSEDPEKVTCRHCISCLEKRGLLPKKTSPAEAPYSGTVLLGALKDRLYRAPAAGGATREHYLYIPALFSPKEDVRREAWAVLSGAVSAFLSGRTYLWAVPVPPQKHCIVPGDMSALHTLQCVEIQNREELLRCIGGPGRRVLSDEICYLRWEERLHTPAVSFTLDSLETYRDDLLACTILKKEDSGTGDGYRIESWAQTDSGLLVYLRRAHTDRIEDRCLRYAVSPAVLLAGYVYAGGGPVGLRAETVVHLPGTQPPENAQKQA